MFWLGIHFAMTLLFIIPTFVYMFLKLFPKTQDPPNLPKGSMGWPLVGETLHFLKPHAPNSLGYFLQERCSKYGKVFKSHLFGSPTIISCDNELSMFILQNEEKFFIGSYPKAIHGILGKLSLLTTTGDTHKKLRNHLVKFTNSYKTNLEYLHEIEKLSISIMESWEGCEEIIFHNETRRFLFNLTVKQVLSIKPEDPLSSKILEDYLSYMKGFVSLPINFPGTAYVKAIKARLRILHTMEGIIQKRKHSGLVKGDFMDVLLSSTNLSSQEVVNIIMDILLGGYETTSTLLALIIYFVSQAPEVLDQLKREHKSIRENKKSGEMLTSDDYKKMEFTSYVFWETLRCGNVVKMVHRKALQDVTFKGYFIPSGWKVLPIFTAAHLDPSLHEDPFTFNPWRWEDPKTIKKVFPFGGGLRLCPGIELAKLETTLFLHHLVLNYRWKLMGDYPLAYPYVDFQGGLRLKIGRVKL